MTISVALMIRKLPPGATVGQIATRPVDRRLPIRIVGRRHCDAFSLSKSRAAGENRFSRSTDVSCYIAESLVFHFRRSRCEGGLDVPSSPRTLPSLEGCFETEMTAPGAAWPMHLVQSTFQVFNSCWLVAGSRRLNEVVTS